MPKSSSLGSPCGVTRMLAGFRSRWTTSRWCACSTAAQTLRNSSTRPRSGSCPAVDALAFHVFQRDEGLAVAGDAAVQEVGDVGMLQRGQDAALFGHALRQARAVRAGAGQQLQRDLLARIAIVALGQVDHAHAAFAQQPQDAVLARLRRVDAAAFLQRRRPGLQPAWRQRIVRPGAGGVHQPVHLRTQLGIACAALHQPGLAGIGCKLQRLHGERLGLQIAVLHRPSPVAPGRHGATCDDLRPNSGSKRPGRRKPDVRSR